MADMTLQNAERERKKKINPYIDPGLPEYQPKRLTPPSPVERSWAGPQGNPNIDHRTGKPIDPEHWPPGNNRLVDIPDPNTDPKHWPPGNNRLVDIPDPNTDPKHWPPGNNTYPTITGPDEYKSRVQMIRDTYSKREMDLQKKLAMAVRNVANPQQREELEAEFQKASTILRDQRMKELQQLDIAYKSPVEKTIINGPPTRPSGKTYKEASAIYLEEYMDVARAGMDPWTHYTLYGKNEGRNWRGPTPDASPESQPRIKEPINPVGPVQPPQSEWPSPRIKEPINPVGPVQPPQSEWPSPRIKEPVSPVGTVQLPKSNLPGTDDPRYRFPIKPPTGQRGPH